MHEHYMRLLEEHGPTARGVGWKDEKYQARQFAALLEVIPEAWEPKRRRVSKENHPISLLDIGCGIGDLCSHFHDMFPFGEYTGIDNMPEMLEAAIAKHGSLNSTWMHLDIAKLNEFNVPHDFVVSCGVFYMRDPHDALEFAGFTKRALTEMFRLCKHGIAANFVTDFRNDFKDERLQYMSPWYALRYAMEHVSPYVRIRTDHYRWWFTLYAYREPQPCRSLTTRTFPSRTG